MAILKRSKNKDQATEAQAAASDKKVEKVAAKTPVNLADTSSVIVKPLISEKAATLASDNQYVFVVEKNANRIQVRNAIKGLYGVEPVSVNIMNVQGKKVRFGRRKGKRSDWKKAIVTLPEGQSINVYEGV